MRKQLREASKNYSKLMATKEMEEELKETEEKQQRSIRHRGYAERRQKLGY
jgi:hypothetical protein